MRTLMIALMLCLVSIMGFGQRTYSSENFITETVDEFGDKTGNIKVGIHAKGYFSNSATTNSCAELIISIMKDRSWYSLYEYCGNHSSDETFEVKFIGTSNRNEVTVRHSIPYSFIELCKDNDTINVKMLETGSYASTSATFKFYKCKEFYKSYIKTFGAPKYITYKVSDKFLNIYKDSVVEKDLKIHIPQLCFHYDKSISLDGKFKNGEYISIYGKNITLDGKEVKKDKYDIKIDFEWFMNNLRVGSSIKIKYENKYSLYKADEPIYEEIIISQDQYDAIINFYSDK